MSSSTSPRNSKPLAVIFYPTHEDEAFNLNDPDTIARIKEIGKSHDVLVQKINSLFNAYEFAESIHNGPDGRKIDHLELACHGNQKEMVFDANIDGGRLSVHLQGRVRQIFEDLIGMVAPNGVIVAQSCNAGSTELEGENILQYIARVSKAGQRVIGTSVTKTYFQLYSDQVRHFHLIESETEKDVTNIYQKSKAGDVSFISVNLVDELWVNMFHSNPDTIDFCFELLAEKNNQKEVQRLIAEQCPDLPDKITAYFSEMTHQKRDYGEWEGAYRGVRGTGCRNGIR